MTHQLIAFPRSDRADDAPRPLSSEPKSTLASAQTVTLGIALRYLAARRRMPAVFPRPVLATHGQK